MKLKFDHMYTADSGHRFWKRLRRLGFTTSEREMEHPGKLFCRFVMFRNNMTELPVYLEFVDARDRKKPVRHPGISFRSLGQLKRHSKMLRSKGLRPKFVHKNYEWKKDNKSRLPGWNFVTFSQLGFRTLFPWITEYEKATGRKKVAVVRHSNGVKSVLGIEIEVHPPGRRFFEKLLGRKIDRPVVLPGGQLIFFTPGKATRLRAVVLRATSLDKLPKHSVDQECTWHGRRAAVIHNPSGMWDIFIAEEKV